MGLKIQVAQDEQVSLAFLVHTCGLQHFICHPCCFMKVQNFLTLTREEPSLYCDCCFRNHGCAIWLGIVRDRLSLTEDRKSEIFSESEFSSLSCAPEKSQTGESVRK